MQQTLRRIFAPPPLPTVLIAVPSFLLMALSVSGVVQNPVVIYASYLLATYSLILVCAKLPAVFRWLKRRFVHLRPVEALLRRPFPHRLVTDSVYRTRLSLRVSLAVNLGYAVIKFGFGAAQASSWLMVLGAYYSVLALMKGALLLYFRRHTVRADISAEWRRYRFCGAVLAGMNLVLIAMVLHILMAGAHASYPGVLIYAMALYAFYAVILALIGLRSFRKHGSPLLSAGNFINMTAALVSMLSLTTAMLVQFGSGAPQFIRRMNAAVGGGVCFLVFLMSVYMVLRATRALRKPD